MKMRMNEKTFGRVPVDEVWGHKSDHVMLNLKVEQAAVLAALCQRAVQEHYAYDHRSPSAKNAPVVLTINYGQGHPAIVVQRHRKAKAV